MILTRTKLAAACLLGAAAVALMASAPHPDQELRVCADPFDLPFSNDQEQGFENKIAHVVAQDLNARVVNYWWPSRRGVLRNSILGGFCDVMIQAPVGLDPVATTKPYYRSTYYFVFRADRGLRLRSLAGPGIARWQSAMRGLSARGDGAWGVGARWGCGGDGGRIDRTAVVW